MVKVLVVGGGFQAGEVVKRLSRSDWVRIVGIVDGKPGGAMKKLAEASGIPLFSGNPAALLEEISVDLVFDLSGDPNISNQLLDLPKRTFDVASGAVTDLLWGMIRELEEKEAALKQQLGEHQALLEINMALAAGETPDQIFETIVSGVTRLTGMPAGSLSVYNKEKEELFLVAAKGLSSNFYRNAVYPVRSGGLTEYILSQKTPVLVPDILDCPAFSNPIILREGIRSLIAIPLISEKGPIGILYSDDFQPSRFPPSLEANLSLLAAQAVIAIQKQQAFEKIKALSIRDPLTGVYNRRYLSKALASEIGRSARLGRPLSLILLDIDHFKQINDRFGHIAGDQVLKQLARAFKAVIRPYDVLARFGGEEFMVLMSDTDEENALASAERLRETAAAQKILPGDNSLTCSFGIAIFHGGEEAAMTPKQFIRCADIALYQAKREGRNRVCRYVETMPVPHSGS